MTRASATNKKILLCRHADAQWPTQHQTDFDRKLSKAGLLQADQMQKWLLHYVTEAPQVICSASVRTLETATIITSVYSDVSIEKYEELYNGASEDLLRIITNCPETHHFLMLVAHNPGISNLASFLSGENFSFNTGQLVLLDLAAEKWEEVSSGTGHVVSTFVPDQF